MKDPSDARYSWFVSGRVSTRRVPHPRESHKEHWGRRLAFPYTYMVIHRSEHFLRRYYQARHLPDGQFKVHLWKLE